MAAHNPAERRQISRIGGLTRYSRETDRSGATAAARAAFRDSFLDQVDPDHVMSETDRVVAADTARRAHMARLSLRSAQARRARKADSATQEAS